jgi:methylglyoxal/glyoxal reductase
MTTNIDTFALRNGVRIPRIGLGVFQAQAGESAREAVVSALECGYRHIDTAAIYGNESDVGEAVRRSEVARDEIFVTTKVWNQDHGYDSTLRAFETSRKKLGLEQIDLYLVHWPVQGKRLDTWKALETLLADGKVRAIGVSNFLPRHLDELAQSAKVLPMVDQIEVSPFLQQRDTREWCARNGLVVEAYSPLTKGLRLKHPEVLGIARDLGCSAAQVLIAWSLAKGLVTLPKSVKPDRIRSNLEAARLELPDGALERLDSLEEGLVTGWDPRTQM